MKKSILTIILTLTMTASVIASETAIIANGNNVSLENPVKIVEGRSYLPLRETGEKVLDATVEWDSSTKSAILRKGVSTIIVPIGSNTITVNGVKKTGDAPAFIENSLTYVPLRAIAEGFNMNVGYENKTITITDNILPQLTTVEKGETIATMHTNYGDIKFRFFPEYAPKAVENFVSLAENGYYDNLTFHRVINEFMIQGGDPTATGAGGNSIWGTPFENEVTPYLRHFRGALCMANAGNYASNGSQFYIVQGNNVSDYVQIIDKIKDDKIEGTNINYGSLYTDDVMAAYEELGGYPSLDYGYTVFGQVIEGMDIVDKIAAVSTDAANKPLEDVIVLSIDISEY